jgi:hypothetical protein
MDENRAVDGTDLRVEFAHYDPGEPAVKELWDRARSLKY